MSEREQALHRRIHENFPKEPIPPAEEMTRCTRMTRYGGKLDHPCWECAEIIEFYEGRRWEEPSGEEIAYHHEAVSYMSREAFGYYMAGWMCRSLENWDSTDIVQEFMLYALSGTISRMGWQIDELYANLTLEQLECVREFVECYAIRCHGGGEDHHAALANIQRHIDGRRDPS